MEVRLTGCHVNHMIIDLQACIIGTFIGVDYLHILFTYEEMAKIAQHSHGQSNCFHEDEFFPFFFKSQLQNSYTWISLKEFCSLAGKTILN